MKNVIQKIQEELSMEVVCVAWNGIKKRLGLVKKQKKNYFKAFFVKILNDCYFNLKKNYVIYFM